MGEADKKVLTGIIYQAVAGFYYVWSNDQSYTTKPRGNFRHQKLKPLVGDYVQFEMDLEDDTSVGRIFKMEPRKNRLLRPPIANVDYALLMLSLKEPDFSYNLLDHFLVLLESYKIKPIILLSKVDLLKESISPQKAEERIQEIRTLYQNIGYSVIALDRTGQDDLSPLIDIIHDGVYVVIGQSGVGKSTLLNCLIPNLELETSVISQSLNRGRHTTRQVSLYAYKDGLIADTPGFSSISYDHLSLEKLSLCFPEIKEASYRCRFSTCVHLNEPHCHVKSMVDEGQIAVSRYQNYVSLYQKLAERPKNYNRK